MDSPELLARVVADIDARIEQLRPAVDEYRGLLDADAALQAERAARSTPSRRSRRASPRPGATSRKTPPPAGAAQGAIAAALEHGSHTVAELVLVTALPATQIRSSLRPLL